MHTPLHRRAQLCPSSVTHTHTHTHTHNAHTAPQWSSALSGLSPFKTTTIRDKLKSYWGIAVYADMSIMSEGIDRRGEEEGTERERMGQNGTAQGINKKT